MISIFLLFAIEKVESLVWVGKDERRSWKGFKKEGEGLGKDERRTPLKKEERRKRKRR